ncbi:conserved hypothetical protein [Candidatus Desulfosporosinus infrequens]|uniref:Uncharacterized protein n=1 Tax=Candidatus Desulfosporosinus infrequens TaxID=2043169 RepID=A0A2U3LLK2_9FIRM|nr:conserved hypothetical protein [Candidatus Desulfosporosinus infrequens]
MEYRKPINSTESIKTYSNATSDPKDVELVVGQQYIIDIVKQTTKKDRSNNNRIVEIMGFTDDFMGDVVVKYLDNNRRGRVRVNVLLPYKEE